MSKTVNIISTGHHLQTSLYGKKVGGVIGDLLHIFAQNSPAHQVRHVAINSDAQLIENHPVLDDAQCRDSAINGTDILLLTEQLSSGSLYLLTLNQEGDILEEVDLKVSANGAQYPAVFVLDDVVTLFWLTQGDSPEIHLSTVKNEQVKLTGAIPLEDLSINLQVATDNNALIISRLAGVQLTPQLIRIENNTISHTVSPADVDTASTIHMAHLNNKKLLLWQNRKGNQIFGQWLDDSLNTTSAPITITTTSAIITAFQPYTTHDESLLIHVLENQPSGNMTQVNQTPRRYQQSINLIHKFIRTDGQETTESQSIALDGSPFFCGGWLDDRFYLVHAEKSPALTIVECD